MGLVGGGSSGDCAFQFNPRDALQTIQGDFFFFVVPLAGFENDDVRLVRGRLPVYTRRCTRSHTLGSATFFSRYREPLGFAVLHRVAGLSQSGRRAALQAHCGTSPATLDQSRASPCSKAPAQA